MNADLAGVDWLGRGGLLMLAFTAAVLCVALLRRPCRRLFGAECAFALWLLPPLAMLASQLPHAATSSNALSGALLIMISTSGGQSPVPGTPALTWQTVAWWLWLAGMAGSLALAAGAQARYRAGLRHAVPLPGNGMPWPVLRAYSPRVGPALVGAWHPRIVVPADFAERYDAEEQALVLAHEAMHARRHDGWWCLLAQLCASLCWFHPLAWWALDALRRDQELACDAAVLREHRGCRRRYVQAMLKTPTAQVLPVGCSWSSRHPLTERIAMLKLSSPNLLRRRVGQLAGLVLASTVSVAVYAASTPAAGPSSRQDAGTNLYQVDIQLALTRDDAKASHARRLKAALCMASGESGTLRTDGILLAAVPHGLGQDRVRLDLAVREKADAQPVNTRLEGALGQPLQASGTVPGENLKYAIEVTPRRGCPARSTASAGVHAPATVQFDTDRSSLLPS
jgi:beta-lactamase regulating signal transducer with metallopeptidase domain